MKEKNKKFKSAKELGSFLGLTDSEMEVVQQKKKRIASELIESLKEAVAMEHGLSQTSSAKGSHNVLDLSLLSRAIKKLRSFLKKGR
jgi:hypothetical protein